MRILSLLFPFLQVHLLIWMKNWRKSFSLQYWDTIKILIQRQLQLKLKGLESVICCLKSSSVLHSPFLK